MLIRFYNKYLELEKESNKLINDLNEYAKVYGTISDRLYPKLEDNKIKREEIMAELVKILVEKEIGRKE